MNLSSRKKYILIKENYKAITWNFCLPWYNSEECVFPGYVKYLMDQVADEWVLIWSKMKSPYSVHFLLYSVLFHKVSPWLYLLSPKSQKVEALSDSHLKLINISL